MVRLLLAIVAGRVAGWLSQIVGRGGSALPGLIAEKIDPRLIDKLVGALPGGVVVVTGTNGKTTTTKVLVGILDSAGVRVITNPTGSNLARGVATRLLQVAGLRGTIDADLAVFEVDEAAVRALGPRLRPRVMVVTNLARDQLDRYGELDTTAAHIAAALHHTGTAVLNGDDPMVAALAGTARDDRLFGAAGHIRAQLPDDRSLYGDLPATGDGPQPDLLIAESAPGEGQRVVLTAGPERAETDLLLPGVYNAYNAAAAVLAARSLGVSLSQAAAAAAAVPPAWGRGQIIDYRNRRIRVLLVKNPAGLNQAIKLLEDVPAGVEVLVAINDNIADGRDVSWLWDARIDDLADSGHHYSTAGTRALDMALRFKYAGIDAGWAEPDLKEALERFAAGVPEGETGYLVPTYTAMLELLDLLLPGTHRREAWT